MAEVEFKRGPIPKEALRWFKAKGLKPSFNWDQVWQEEHAYAFTVAKVMEKDLLQSIKDSLAVALEEGEDFRKWAKNIRDTFDKSGWSQYNSAAQAPHRLYTIYDTNMRSARAEGQWQRIERTKSAMPYLQYNLGPSTVHRVEHEEWEGLILPADDPFWAEHMPPNGFGCKCWVRQLSEKEAEELGIDTAPETQYVEWENPRTGDTQIVPEGIDPGFAYNPGTGRAIPLAKAAAE